MDISREEYIKFMYNPENINNCSKCPENQNFSSWPGNKLPCGQFHCWVELHCKNEEDE